MTMTPIRAMQIAESAALLAWTLRNDARWAHWYLPERWSGMVGLMNHLAIVATALEDQLNGRDWADMIWYITIHEVASAIIEDRLDLSDLSQYYVEL